ARIRNETGRANALRVQFGHPVDRLVHQWPRRVRLAIDSLPGGALVQPEGRAQVNDAGPSLQKPARDRYGGPGGEREQHEVWRLDILKAHEVEAGVIEIRMNPLDRPWRSAGNPRDVRMRMAQQDPQRFPAHVATPTD